jgi:hypothetical protein
VALLTFRSREAAATHSTTCWGMLSQPDKQEQSSEAAPQTDEMYKGAVWGTRLGVLAGAVSLAWNVPDRGLLPGDETSLNRIEFRVLSFLALPQGHCWVERCRTAGGNP